MNDIGYFDVDGMSLRAEPARDDACFKIVYRDADMHEYLGTEGVARRETLHRHMTNEMTSIDIAAACVAEFSRCAVGPAHGAGTAMLGRGAACPCVAPAAG